MIDPPRRPSPALRIASLCAIILAVGCSPAPNNSEKYAYDPINDSVAIFWDRQTTETAQLLGDIVDEFNATHNGLPLKLEQSGNYGDIYRKVLAGTRAGTLPAMAVVYETMIPEYADAQAIVPLDSFMNDPENGISEEARADFFPAVLETNTFDELGGQMYSFPFTKSVLMLFFNKRVLAEAGIEAPPATWEAFVDQCRTIKRVTGKQAWAVDVDPSTIDGMIYSMGGDIVDGRETLYDSEPALKVFEIFEILTNEDLIYQIPPRTFNDETAFGQDQIAFSLRTSASRPHFAIVMEDPEAWGMVPIPQLDPDNPRTVVYGGNVCIFNTTPEQQNTAWAFIKYFTSPEISVRWALGTGYLPFRKSAIDSPTLQAFWKEWPYNRAAYDSLANARPEPNLRGWQEIRGLIANAQTSVLTGLATGREAAEKLKREADAVLAAQR